ncbi:hypothetical protein BKA70DRAFT_1446649 [Coprinopsis sp. MPI-PUGE-AT-0042]|nr:hypothetical protein BKA70DRAFT_1446649 [Coprinopsis sp. MPI-PUGE-AT-0042]
MNQTMNFSAEVGTIAAKPPPDLARYISSNIILPSELSPCLDAFLCKLSQPMDSLKAEISALKKLLRSKEKSYKRGKAILDAHLRIKAPMRKVPQELLGIIFRFALHAPYNQYRDVECLRQVCSSWRHIATTTPGLWDRLNIDLDRWCGYKVSEYNDEELLLHLKERLAPWMCILSQTTPYHLNITSYRGPPSDDHHAAQQTLLVHHLLSSTPAPNVLTLSLRALHGILSYPSPLFHVVNMHVETDTKLYGFGKIEHVLPCLEILLIDAPIDSSSHALKHSSLQILHLGDLGATPLSFQEMMRELPTLRELKIACSSEVEPPYTTLANSPAPYVHSSLQALIVEGEDLLFLCAMVSFPNLLFIAIRGESVITAAAALSKYVVPRFLVRTSSRGLTVILRGRFFQDFVTSLIQSLPPNSHLAIATFRIEGHGSNYHSIAPFTIESDNVEQIFCTANTRNLSWLGNGPARRSSSRPLPIRLPIDPEGADNSQIESRREELESSGFILDSLAWDEIEPMICAVVPEFRERQREYRDLIFFPPTFLW